MKKITMYAATGNLGYGFPEIALENGLKSDPAFLACDAGSTDPGPNYLGMGKPFVSRIAAKRDLRLLTKAARSQKIPLIIGSAGGSGSDAGVDETLAILREILDEESLSCRVGIVRSEQKKEFLLEKLQKGKIEPLTDAPPLDEETIRRSTHTVAAMGPEPIQRVLAMGAEIVICGRATDASIYAAIPLSRGFDPGLVWHASKIVECGAAMAVPKSSDSMLAHIYDDHFVLEPPNPAKKVKTVNVAAHTMYECPHPTMIHEPSGIIDTGDCWFEQLDDRHVKVGGSRYLDAPYSVKLESVESLGYRAICIGGTHDPTLISIIDEQLERVRGYLIDRVRTFYPGMTERDYKVHFHRYGMDGVMGTMEMKPATGHEIGFVIDVVAEDQEKANSILAAARTLLMHSDYPGRKCIAGSIAFPFSPSDITVGEVFRFNMNHALQPDDPLEPFRIEVRQM